jgi:hypothetical protein
MGVIEPLLWVMPASKALSPSVMRVAAARVPQVMPWIASPGTGTIRMRSRATGNLPRYVAIASADSLPSLESLLDVVRDVRGQWQHRASRRVPRLLNAAIRRVWSMACAGRGIRTCRPPRRAGCLGEQRLRRPGDTSSIESSRTLLESGFALHSCPAGLLGKFCASFRRCADIAKAGQPASTKRSLVLIVRLGPAQRSPCGLQDAPPSTQKRAQYRWFSFTGRAASARLDPSSNAPS